MKRRSPLTEGPVVTTLFKMAGPMVFGIMAIVVFNLVDTFFVAKLGPIPLAAISFTFPVVMILGSIAMGIGTGAAAVISQSIGKADRTGMRRLTTDALLLGVAIVVVFVVVGLLTIDPLFRAMGASDEVLPYIRRYMTIWYLGMVFVVVPMVGNNAIRATGDTTVPSLIMIVAAVINAIMDPLLIFGYLGFPALGIEGAALATVIGRATTLVVSLLVLHKREHAIDWSLPRLRAVLASWRRILRIGIPTAGTHLLVPVGMAVVTRIVSSHGPLAVGAVGAGTRLESFALMPAMALASVTVPFMGQNYGARAWGRIKRAFSVSASFAVGWGVVAAAVLFLAGDAIASAYVDDAEVAPLLARYLAVVPLGYAGMGLFQLVTAGLNGIDRPFLSASLNAGRMVAVLIPMTYLGSLWWEYEGILWAIVAANLLSGVVGFLTMTLCCRHRETPGGAPAVPVAMEGEGETL